MIRDLVGSPSAAVDAQIIADLTTLGWTRPLTVGLGQSKDFTFNASPSIVWVPTRDKFDAPKQVESVRPVGIANNASLRAVHTRWVGLEARLWAVFSDHPTPPTTEDYSATEVLLNTVIMALRKTCYGAYELGPGRWEDARGAEDMVLGRAYALRLWIAVPIYDAAGAAQQQTLTSLPLTRQDRQPGRVERDRPSVGAPARPEHHAPAATQACPPDSAAVGARQGRRHRREARGGPHRGAVTCSPARTSRRSGSATRTATTCRSSRKRSSTRRSRRWPASPIPRTPRSGSPWLSPASLRPSATARSAPPRPAPARST
jgi:hypothetical protein